MKHTVIFVFCFYLGTLLNAAVYKTVNVSAGGLSTILTATRKSQYHQSDRNGQNRRPGRKVSA